MKICCVTGHKPKGFHWYYRNTECAIHTQYLNRMKYKLITHIEDNGFRYFISGGAIGVDIDFANFVIGLRDSCYPNITLEIAIPCIDQDKKWDIADKERYKKIITNADLTTYISQIYDLSCMQRRNEYMVNKSELVVAFWNGENYGGTYNTISYAKKKGKRPDITYLNDLTDGFV